MHHVCRKWDFHRLAEEVPLSEKVCTVAWVPFDSFQIRDVQQIHRRVKLETPSSKEEESSQRSRTADALFLLLDSTGLCSEDRRGSEELLTAQDSGC